MTNTLDKQPFFCYEYQLPTQPYLIALIFMTKVFIRAAMFYGCLVNVAVLLTQRNTDFSTIMYVFWPWPNIKYKKVNGQNYKKIKLKP